MMHADDLDPQDVARVADDFVTGDGLDRLLERLVLEAGAAVDGDPEAAAAIVALKLINDPALRGLGERVVAHELRPLIEEVLTQRGFEQDPDSDIWTRKQEPA